MNGRIIVCVVCFQLAVGSGCSKREEQYAVEQKTIFGISRLLKLYATNPGLPITNLQQVYYGLGVPYPHESDKEFRRFGHYAGFTNSFFEKYVFFPQGVKHQLISGDLLFMNAVPYPGPDGKLQRMVVSRSHDIFYKKSIAEESVQRILKDVDITEPKPVPMPPPPPVPLEEPKERDSLFVRVQIMFFGLLEGFGLSRGTASVLWNLFLGLPVIALVVLCFRFARRADLRKTQ